MGLFSKRSDLRPVDAGREVGVEASARVPADGVEDMRQFKVELRPERVRATGELFVNVQVVRESVEHARLVIEDVTSGFEYLGADVLVLRIDFAKKSEKRWDRMSERYPVEDGVAFRYVALMYGEQLVAVKIIEDV